jgi:hypothetical protein
VNATAAKIKDRRQIDESQRGMCAARLATLTKGGDRRSEDFKTPNGALKIDKAAELFNTSKRTVDRARKVIADDSQNAIRIAFWPPR